MLWTGLDEVTQIWTRVKSNVTEWMRLHRFGPDQNRMLWTGVDYPIGLDGVSIEYEFE